jgi:hypothetical protein
MQLKPGGPLGAADELVGLIATWEREGREGERELISASPRATTSA